MQLEAASFSASDLVALAQECLEHGGYRVTRETSTMRLLNGRSLLAEDDYSVLAVVAYDTWERLQEEWGEAQSGLVALLARNLTRSEPKAWDGYLVLMCAGPLPIGGDPTEIERDTNRIRKIVATGEHLRTTSDVATLLDLFMPLPVTELEAGDPDVLLGIPDLLANRASKRAVQVIVDAYKSLEPPIERLHAFLTRSPE